MIEKNVWLMDCNEEKWLQKFSARFARLLVYAKICIGLSPWIKNRFLAISWKIAVINIKKHKQK